MSYIIAMIKRLSEWIYVRNDGLSNDKIVQSVNRVISTISANEKLL